MKKDKRSASKVDECLEKFSKLIGARSFVEFLRLYECTRSSGRKKEKKMNKERVESAVFHEA